MYIDPFWCGVLVTIAAETVAVVVTVIVATVRNFEKLKKEEEGK